MSQVQARILRVSERENEFTFHSITDIQSGAITTKPMNSQTRISMNEGCKQRSASVSTARQRLQYSTRAANSAPPTTEWDASGTTES